MNEKQYYVDWINFVRDEVCILLGHKNLLDQLIEVIKNNSDINKPNSFYDWLNSAYIADVLVRMRRLVDQDPKTKSLVSLLINLKNDPDHVSKAVFVKMYERSPLPKEQAKSMAEQDYDQNFSEDNKYLVADRNVLKKSFENIKIFVDRELVHLDRDKPQKLITYSEVNVVMSRLEQMTIKYQLLLTGTAMLNLTPLDLTEWRNIFRVPWIK